MADLVNDNVIQLYSEPYMVIERIDEGLYRVIGDNIDDSPFMRGDVMNASELMYLFDQGINVFEQGRILQ